MGKELKDIPINELLAELQRRKVDEKTKKFSTKQEVEYTMTEVSHLEAEGSGSLFVVRVDDGCEGWEALVNMDADTMWDNDELVLNHIINFLIDNDYYKPGDIDEITVEEICRYNRPIFKIS